MIKIETVSRELFEGNVSEGIDFWHTKGTNVVLYQCWSHRAAGRVYEQVQVTFTTKPDLISYLVENQWLDDYKVIDTKDLKL